MHWCLFIAFLFLTNFANAKRQKLITESTKPFDCGFIVKSCESQCVKNPRKYAGSYVRWMFDIGTDQMFCKRYNATDIASKASFTLLETEIPLHTVTFDVVCCGKEGSEPPRIPKVIRPSAPLPSQKIECVDQKTLDTLFILGVATLGSIVLMCIFVLVGLFMYKQRTKYYKYKQTSKSEERQGFARDSEKTASTIVTMSDFGHEKSECSSPGNCVSMPPVYFDGSKKSSASNRSSKIEQTYVNETVTSNGTTVASVGSCQSGVASVAAQAENNRKVSESIAAKRLSSRLGIAGEYEMRGGFIRPINKSIEPKSLKFLSTSEPKNDTRHTTSAIPSQPDPVCPSHEVKTQSNDVEDPYVQAPPLKSHRSQQKNEQVDSYQKLIPNNNNEKHETSDYNMLLHNSVACNGTDAKQFLILQNNSESNTTSSGTKSEVILKSTPSSPSIEVKS